MEHDEWQSVFADLERALQIVTELKEQLNASLAKAPANAPVNTPVNTPANTLANAPAKAPAVTADSFLFYLLTDTNNSHPHIKRNRQILDSANISYQIVKSQPQDISVYNYQKTLINTLQEARKQDVPYIVVLDGTQALNYKFADIFKELLQELKNLSDFDLVYLGNCHPTTVKDITNYGFDAQIYLTLYDDLKRANITTEDSAKSHWNIYGKREFRPANIGLNLADQSFDNNYGFIINRRHVPILSEVFQQQTEQRCQNIIGQWHQMSNLNAYYCYPHLIIPKRYPRGHPKVYQDNFKRLCKQKGWYAPFFQ